MKKVLAQAAKHGRFGDDSLLHVSKEEIAGLASLVPGGKLPVNPKTGLHEAFFFLPFLAAAALPAATTAAAAIPAAATAAAGTAAAGGLTAAALPAAGAATTGAALGAGGAGLAALPAATGAAGAGLGAINGAASALPAAGASLGSAGAAGAGAAGTGAALGGATGLPSVLAGTPFAGTSALPAAGSAIAAPAAATGAATPLATGASALAPAASAAAPAASSGGLGGLFSGMNATKLLQYGALGSMLMPRGGGGGGSTSKDKKSQADIGGKQYDRGDAAAPPDGGAQGGTSPEFRFFPQARYYAEGGMVKPRGYAEGGPIPGGVQSLIDQGSQPESTDDEQLIDMTAQAIQGQTPNAQAVVQQFVQRFGPQALQHLVAQVRGSQSQSDGLSDSVPAVVQGGIAGQEPAQLSEGEFVVPSDVVSHLGNGSTEAGARQLQKMNNRVRKARGASDPNQIDPNELMPA